jgi:hypothetical protein
MIYHYTKWMLEREITFLLKLIIGDDLNAGVTRRSPGAWTGLKLSPPGS